MSILLVGETADGALASITLELLALGRKLADRLGGSLATLLTGESAGSLAQEAIYCGSDVICMASGQALGQYQPEAFATAVVQACALLKPSGVLLGHTDLGLDVAPRVAAKLDAGLAMDCVDIDVDEGGRLLMTRPVFGGNAQAVVAVKGARVQMATLRPYSVAPATRDDERQGEILPLALNIQTSELRLQPLGRVKEQPQGVRLADAKVVVTGGYGVGKEQYSQIWQLANLLGGAVGASRPVCEEGWVPSTHMVGQTGKVVSPDLYLAVGVSGAPQHIAGCGGAKLIAAVNRDSEANIFKVAHVGLLGDCKQIVPELIALLREQQTG